MISVIKLEDIRVLDSHGYVHRLNPNNMELEFSSPDFEAHDFWSSLDTQDSARETCLADIYDIYYKALLESII